MNDKAKQILELCKKPRTRQSIADEMDMTANAVHKWITKLRLDGYMVKIKDFGDKDGSTSKYRTTEKYISKTNGGFTICGVKF